MPDLTSSTHHTDSDTEESTVNNTTIYVRGTKTVKLTTAAAAPGDRVLTTGEQLGPVVRVAGSKTDSYVRTVESKSAHLVSGFHRAQRRYVLHFTDGTRSGDCTPAQTWHHVPKNAQ